MQVRLGSYIGDGSSSRTIAIGESWTPSMVEVRGGANNTIFLTAQMAADGVNALPYVGAAGTASITALGAGTFTVNTSALVNTAGTTYYFRAIYDDGAGDFAQFKYTGNGVNGRALTILGFTPAMVTVKANNTSIGVFRTGEMAANTSLQYTAGGPLTNAILSLDATGFTLGNGATANANTVVYYGYAFKAVTNQFATGSFVGDGVAGKQISVGWRPSFVQAKNGTTGEAAAAQRYTLEGDNRSFYVGATSEQSARIARFGVDYFEVGNGAGVNTNGNTSYWYAMFGAYQAGNLLKSKLLSTPLIRGLVR